jgi:hypothetical protein
MADLRGMANESEGGEALAPTSNARCKFGILKRQRPFLTIPDIVRLAQLEVTTKQNGGRGLLRSALRRPWPGRGSAARAGIVAHCPTVYGGRKPMLSRTEVWQDGTMPQEEALCVARRFESPHGPLPLVRRWVEVFHAVVQIPMLAMLDARQ